MQQMAPLGILSVHKLQTTTNLTVGLLRTD